ncbi:MAG: SDR family NAD(P)-dependent oxidoreductase [Weeksellaceae bacterium]|nr:SDR family NAD(P)-dependent oxidoreductase [Weeksellaceae bacterium]
MKYAVVTGVSSGIGKATAILLLQNGYTVFGSVRKEQDAESLRREYPETFHTLIFDTTDYPAVDQAIASVEKVVGEHGLDLLVNNAGIAKYGPMQHVSIDMMREQFEVNVHSVVYFTQKCMHMLGAYRGAQHHGRIITISSTAGVMTRPLLGSYSGSKHAIEAIFDAWRREMMVYGIPVILIQPGPIKTEIWHKAKKAENPFMDTDYGKAFDSLNSEIEKIEDVALDVSAVTKAVWHAATNKNPKTRYIVAPKKAQFLLAMYVLPDKTLDKIFFKQIKKLF